MKKYIGGLPRFCFAAAFVFGAMIAQPALAQIFTEDFDDNTAGWTEISALGVAGVPGQGDAVFGYDYSADGIPEAPNSGTIGGAATSGVRLRSNLGGIGGLEDQFGIALDNANFNGDYTVEVDAWINWVPDGNFIGTTIFGALFVGDAVDNNFSYEPGTLGDPIANPGHVDPARAASRGAGMAWNSDGDCSNCDYILLKNAFELDTNSGQFITQRWGFGNQSGIDAVDATPDYNDDGVIDAADYTVWRDNLGATGGTQGFNPANGFRVVPPLTNQVIDGEDYAVWAENYGLDVQDPRDVFPGGFNLDAVTGGAQNINPSDTTQDAGVAGFQWVTLIAEVEPNTVGDGPNPGDTGVVTFSILNPANGKTLVVGRVDNSRPDIPDDNEDGTDCGFGDSCGAPSAGQGGSGAGILADEVVDLEGRLTLAVIDFFSGAAANVDLGYVLFDNLTVSATSPSSSVPEPSAALLALIAAGFATARRRN